MQGETACMKLASAAEVVKIWHANDFSLLHQLPVKSASCYRYVHWSWDFQQLVCVPVGSRRIVLALVKDEVSHISQALENEPTAAQFCNISRTLIGIGHKNGSILLWDIKDKKAAKTFYADSEITCLQFNWSDSYLATGSINGTISVHNCKMGLSSKPFGDAAPHAIRSLQYSYFKKALVGSASDDGTISLWDANTQSLKHNFPSFHVAPATGIRFSPTNAMLAISVGLDRKIGCFDLETKKVIKSIECQFPLTSVDFKDDGYTIAVGSSGGKILVYDFRAVNEPLHILSAHSSSVQHLAFQNALFGESCRMKISRRNSKSNFSTVYKQNEVTDCFDASEQMCDIQTRDNAGRYSLTSEIFSPIREDNFPNGSFGDSTKRLSIVSNIPSFEKDCSKAFMAFSPLGNSGALENGSDGSPLLLNKSPSHLKNNSARLSAASNSTSVNDAEIKKMGDQSTVSESSFTPNGSKLNEWPTEKPANSVHCTSCLSLKSMCPSNGKEEAIFLGENSMSPADHAPPTLPQAVTVIPPSSEMEHLKPGSEKGLCLGFSSSGDSADEGRGTGVHTTPLTPEAFHAEYIRQCIVDVMEDYADEMRKGIYQQHVAMCRMFQLQEDRIESLFSKYAVDQDLLSEVVNLKKENKYLKHTFR